MLKNQERFLKKYNQLQSNDERKSENKKRKFENIKPNTQINSSKKIKNGNATDPSILYIDDPYSAPIVKEAKKFFLQNFKREFPVHMGNKEGWRNIAKLPVRRESKDLKSKPVIGLFSPGSRKLISRTEFAAHHPSINILTPILLEGFIKYELSGYSDEDGTGDIRYIMMSVHRSSCKIQLTIVFNKQEVSKQLKKFSKWLKREHKDKLHSIWVHFRNASSTSDSAIFGRDENSWKLLYSFDKEERGFICEKMKIIDIVNSPNLCYSPSVFRQANLDQFECIINEIRKRIPNNSKILELYAGVCTIGLNLLDKVSFISCSDENPNNVDCFKKSLEFLDEKSQLKVSYTAGSASEIVKKDNLSQYDVIIVDPSRKGMESDVVDAFLKSKTPKLLFYVSCGFTAFQRDAKLLTAGNSYKLLHAEGHILFPGADHIETLAVFERK